jgi:hypothetical protein
MRLHNFLSLLHLVTRQIRGKEPLIDYFQSHFVTSIEHLNIIFKNTMDKATIEEIVKQKRKERKHKQAKNTHFEDYNK